MLTGREFLGRVEEELRTTAAALSHARDTQARHAPSVCRKCDLISLADEAADRHALIVTEGVTR